jgi:hypothetical protein
MTQSTGLSRFGTRGSQGVPANSCRPTGGFPTSAPFVLKSRALPIELTALPQLWRSIVRCECEHMFVSPQPPVPLVTKRGRPPEGDSTAELRVCRRHGLVEFHLCSQGSRGGYRWRCKRCAGEAVTRRLQKVKRTLVEEAGGCCAVCGYDRCIVNLHFHHVDPSTKSFALSVASGKSLAKLRAEATKCVLVCANCHGEIESGLVDSPPPGAVYRRA